MAGFVFETGTQALADGFEAGDQLVFQTDAPNQISATYNAAAGTTASSIIISDGTKSLTFGGADFASPTTVSFLAHAGTADFGTVGADKFAVTGDAKNDAASVAFGFDGNDTITVSGTAAHKVDGGAGDDTITPSGSGAFTIYGGLGADKIDASAATGNLHIFGFQAGAGNPDDGADTITVANGSNYINGGAGADIITINGGSNRVQGGADNDTITISGAGSNAVNGNKGDDTIDASAATGSNTLRGGMGDDIILAGKGHDTVMGDVGDDTLTVSTAAGHVTVLTGGAGSDTFDFSNAGSGTALANYSVSKGAVDATAKDAATFYQEITDFTHGDDVIALVGSAGTTATATNDVIHAFTTSFATAAEATNAAIDYFNGHATTEVITAQVGTATYLFSDSGDSIVKVDNVSASSFSHTDFI